MQRHVGCFYWKGDQACHQGLRGLPQAREGAGREKETALALSLSLSCTFPHSLKSLKSKPGVEGGSSSTLGRIVDTLKLPSVIEKVQGVLNIPTLVQIRCWLTPETHACSQSKLLWSYLFPYSLLGQCNFVVLTMEFIYNIPPSLFFATEFCNFLSLW